LEESKNYCQAQQIYQRPELSAKRKRNSERKFVNTTKIRYFPFHLICYRTGQRRQERKERLVLFKEQKIKSGTKYDIELVQVSGQETVA
jgi:hypothetical protein